MPLQAEDVHKANYTAKRQPDCIPLICNEFLSDYLPLKCNAFDMNTAIGLTQHFTTWLYNRKFTKAKLELIKN